MNKDPNASGGANGRKASISHGQNSNNFNISSPASSRPTTARRQATSDSLSGLGSPAGTGRFFSRDETSPFLTRRPTDLKDAGDDRAEDAKNNSPFGGLVRSSTAGNVLGNGPGSPWGATPASATMSPMGNFGSFTVPGSSANQAPTDKRPAYGTREQSRFAQLMPKESSEDVSKAAERTWRPRPRTDTDPFGDDTPTGSAALGGGQDTSPPLNSQRRAPGLDTPTRGASGDFGMSELPGFRGQNHQTPQSQRVDNDTMSPDSDPLQRYHNQ